MLSSSPLSSGSILAAFCGAFFLGAITTAQPVVAPAEPPPAAVEQAAPAISNAEIEALINQLASPDQAVQKAAQDKLVSLGEDVRKALEAYIKAKSAAEMALARIDTIKVASTALITLNVTDATPEQVLAEIAKQTGYDLQTANANTWGRTPLPKLTLSWDKKPFWPAMRELCEKGGISFYNTGYNQRAFQFMPAANVGQNILKFPASIDGAFAVVVNGLSRTNTVDLASPKNIQRNLNMQMQVLVEPKVKVVRYDYNADVEEAVDDKGNSLVGGRDRMGRGYNNARGVFFSMGVPLQYPANAGEKITKLRGKLHFFVQTRSENLEIPDVLTAKEVSKTVAGHRLLFKQLTKLANSQYQAHVIVYRDNMEQQAFWDMVNNPAMHLVDADGVEYNFNGVNSGNNTNDTYEMKMTFTSNSRDGFGGLPARAGVPVRPPGAAAGAGAPGEPVKFVWEIPTATQEITVPFEFTDLPLP